MATPHEEGDEQESWQEEHDKHQSDKGKKSKDAEVERCLQSDREKEQRYEEAVRHTREPLDNGLRVSHHSPEDDACHERSQNIRYVDDGCSCDEEEQEGKCPPESKLKGIVPAEKTLEMVGECAS